LTLNDTYTPCFLLESGDIYYIDYESVEENGMPHSIEKKDSIEGNIIRISYDEEDNFPVFVVSKDQEDTIRLHAICKEAKIVHLEQDKELDENF